MAQETLDQITAILRDVFDEYEGPITRETTAKDIPQWDSLAHVQVMVLIEKAAGIRFATSEIQGLTSLGDLVDLIDQKKAA